MCPNITIMNLVSAYLYILLLPIDVVSDDRPTMKELSVLKSSKSHQKVKIIETLAPNWRSVGLQLSLKSERLDIIDANNPRDVRKCCERMFEEWLHSPSASWKTLITVLEDLDYNVLAGDVEEILNEK